MSTCISTGTSECQHPRYCLEHGCPSLKQAIFPEPGNFDPEVYMRMRVVLDVDEVLAALLPAWLELYNMDYKDNLTLAQVSQWDMSKVVKPECGTGIYQYLDTPHIYDERVTPVLDALKGVQTLRARGHHVVFATSAMNGHAGAKLRWLQRWGFLPKGKKVDPDYFECSDKSRLGDVLVDDRPSNISEFRGRTVLFAMPHNAGWEAPDMIADGWAHVIECIDTIAYEEYAKHFQKACDAIPAGDANRPEDVAHSGVKYDGGKARFDLIPAMPLFQVAQVFTFGAVKYDDHNWRKGMKWSRVLAASMRHIFKFMSGEWLDQESELPHLAHAVFGLLVLLEYAVVAREWNDMAPDPARIGTDQLPKQPAMTAHGELSGPAAAAALTALGVTQ